MERQDNRERLALELDTCGCQLREVPFLAGWKRFWRKCPLHAAAPEMVQALQAIKIRIVFGGLPGEPRTTEGGPDWSREIALLETALRKAGVYGEMAVRHRLER